MIVDNTDHKENRKTIRTFAWASFFNDLGSDMFYPIWPIFVTSVLGANMAVLGFIDGLGDTIVSLSQAASGYFSDRIRKRKVFVWTGYLLGTLSRIGYAFSSVWQMLIPFRILDRAGKIRNAPRDAIIADISTRENRGKNFGLLRMMDNLGAICGIVICILFFDWLGYRNLFLIAAIPSVIGVVLILAFIKETKLAATHIYKGISFKDLSGNFKLFLLLSAFFALGSFSYSFLLIYAERFGFKVAFVPVMYLIFTVVAAIVSLPFGKLADKIGRKPMLLLSFLLWGLVCLTFILIQNRWAIVLSFVFYGLHKGALEPVQKTFVAELAPVDSRASSLGGFHLFMSIYDLPASLIAGMLWDKIGIFAPFYFSLALTALAIAMMFLVKEESSK